MQVQRLDLGSEVGDPFYLRLRVRHPEEDRPAELEAMEAGPKRRGEKVARCEEPNGARNGYEVELIGPCGLTVQAITRGGR